MRTGLNFLKGALAAWCFAPVAPWGDHCAVSLAQPTIYYVSPLGTGDHSGDDEQNTLPVTEVQTMIDQGELEPGDEVLFVTGIYTGVYDNVSEEYLPVLDIQDVQGTGPDAQSIMFAAAPGNTPVFSGSLALGTWVTTVTADEANGLPAAAVGSAWKISLPNSIGEVDNLYHEHPSTIPGDETARFRLKTRARYPDDGEFNHANPGSAVTSGGFVDDELTTVPHVGAYIVLRYNSWGYARKVVSQHNTTTDQLTYGTITTADPQSGDWGYYLEGLVLDITQVGEWAYHATSHTLYYWPPGGAQPGVDAVRICTEESPDALIFIGGDGIGVEHVTIEGLTFEQVYNKDYGNQSAGSAIRVQIGAHRYFRVQDCMFRDLNFGINEATDFEDEYPQYTTYQNNTFLRNYTSGINAQSELVEVVGNTFKDISLEPGQTGPYFTDATALYLNINDGWIHDNTFLNVGGSAITAKGFDLESLPWEYVVEHNYIDGFCTALNDHAAITFDQASGLRVSKNMIRGGIPDVRSSAGGDFQSDKSVGLYFGYALPLDHVIIEENIVTDAGNGIAVDHAPGHEYNVVRSNCVFGNRSLQLAVIDRGDPPNPQYQSAYNTTFAGNILYSLTAAQDVVWVQQVQATSWVGGSQPKVDFGTFSNNFYFNPFSRITHRVNIVQDGYQAQSGFLDWIEKPRIIPFTYQGWRSLVEPEDGSSATSPLRLLDYAIQGTPTTVTEHTELCVPADIWYDDTDGIGDGSLDGNFKRFINQQFAERTALTLIETGSNTPPDQAYRITFRMRSPDTDAIRLGPIRTWDPLPVRVIEPSAYVGLTKQWETYEVLLRVPASAEARRFNISFQNLQYAMNAMGTTASSVIEIDNILTERVDPVDGYLENVIAQDHILRYNCPLADASDQNVHVPNPDPEATSAFVIPWNADECWSDVHGNFYSAGQSYDLYKWESVVLFKYNVDLAPLTFNGDVYDITATETWTENWNIAGSVVVRNGGTLIIDGAHIGFAESTAQVTTNLTVEPGGTLIMRNGATLRNWMGCDAPAAMWDGVKVLGNGTTAGAGLVDLQSGARITDAYVGLLGADVPDPSAFEFSTTNATGGRVQADGASFINNRIAVFMGEIPNYASLTFDDSWFTNCDFRTTRALHTGNGLPGAHVRLESTQNVLFESCRFSNSSGLNPTEPWKWGYGIVPILTTVRIDGGDAPEQRTRFNGLFMGVHHLSFDPSKTYRIDQADFSGCFRGVWNIATDNSRITRNFFEVLETQSAAMGAYMYGSNGHEFEENVFKGAPGATSAAEVGAEFTDGGAVSSFVYNNRFDGFQGVGGSGYSTALLLNRVNAGPGGANGLQAKCNDFSATTANSFDMATTRLGSWIGSTQGSTPIDQQDFSAPAGNTFTLTCTVDPNVHLHVNIDADLNDGVGIAYWHHTPQSGVQLKPECSNAAIAMSPAFVDYFKVTACPSLLSPGIVVDDDIEVTTDAHNEFAVLAEVYGDWQDGGSTEGLVNYILDPENDSYAVRNRLMLVAPAVTTEAWRAVMFTRNPALNPWHLAQALLANSPLEPAVLAMVESLPIEEFFIELVRGGQTGVSMHSIYKSELAAWDGTRARAASDALSKVLLGAEPGSATHLLHALSLLTKSGLEPQRLAIHLATGDAQGGRTLIDAMRQALPNDGWWHVQDLLMAQREQSLALRNVNGTTRSTLETIAADQLNTGKTDAQAWIWLIDEAEPDTETALPTLPKRGREQQETRRSRRHEMLRVHPNPARHAKDPVYLVYQIPEGVEHAEILVVDAVGRLAYTARVAPSSGIAEVPAGTLASGTHVLTLVCDGILIGSAKLMVQR